MTSSVRFAITALAGTNKAGVLPQDENGYRTMVIGGLNMFNSAGQYYTLDGCKQLFEGSSHFMRRVGRGALRGEVGHPRQEKGESFDDYVARVLEIRESNVCVHFKEIWLDPSIMKGPDGKPVVAIMAKLTGSGPKGEFLNKALSNPNENVCFSIRSFTRDYWERGIYMRELKNIVTFDYVNEPGISIANKYNAPALEAISDSIVTRGSLERAITTPHKGIGQESLLTASELFKAFNWDVPKNAPPAFSNW